MRVLVTGATGFAGRHLLRLLLSRGYTPFGTYLSPPPNWDIASPLLRCDLRDANSVRRIIRRVRPGQIYHLAAQSSPLQSLSNIRDVYEVNFWGTYNLLEAARQLTPTVRILVVGSGQCYGRTDSPRGLLTESRAFAPPNPYALSKAAADMLAGQYYSRFGLRVIRARPFNHTGPGQQQGFVCSDYARQIAAIELGQQRPPLRVRDASARRDFSDVRDVVRAYEMLVKKGEPGEAYNVASGHSVSVREIVSLLVSFCSRPVRLLEDRHGLRSGDIPTLCGSSLKLRRATGWKPEYNMRATLRDLLETWKIHSTEKVNGRSIASAPSRKQVRHSTSPVC